MTFLDFGFPSSKCLERIELRVPSILPSYPFHPSFTSTRLEMAPPNNKSGDIGKGFNEFLQKDRKRKQNEELANQIFKRPQAARNGASRTPSLASRVGVQKRPLNRRTVSDNTILPTQQKRAQRLASALSNVTSRDDVFFDTTQNNLKKPLAELSIRGKGDTITVIAQNFVAGTTISDIESVLAPDPSQCLLSSRLISASPTVMAELTFGSRPAAMAIVERFNNQRVRSLTHFHVFANNIRLTVNFYTSMFNLINFILVQARTCRNEEEMYQDNLVLKQRRNQQIPWISTLDHPKLLTVPNSQILPPASLAILLEALVPHNMRMASMASQIIKHQKMMAGRLVEEVDTEGLQAIR
jgi:hypothetical protein